MTNLKTFFKEEKNKDIPRANLTRLLSRLEVSKPVESNYFLSYSKYIFASASAATLLLVFILSNQSGDKALIAGGEEVATDMYAASVADTQAGNPVMAKAAFSSAPENPENLGTMNATAFSATKAQITQPESDSVQLKQEVIGVIDSLNSFDNVNYENTY